MKKIILTGYMGSGKSTIASLLHDKTGIKHIDLDKAIEQECKLSIAEIFRQKGEICFRKLEHQAFSKLMHADDTFILSLGGGTPCYANNHLLLNGSDIVSIYLNASIDGLYNRIVGDTNQRPLVDGKSEEEMKEFIAKTLFERSFYYHQSMFKIDTDGKSPEAIVLEIEKILT